MTSANSPGECESVRISYLCKKGVLASLFSELRSLPSVDLPRLGRLLNLLKHDMQSAFNRKLDDINSLILEREERKFFDVTVPGRRSRVGSLHPISIMSNELVDILSQMGFSLFLAPEIDDDYNNYGSLNYEDDHPARDMHDTFYLDKSTLLRSHTTNFQSRVLQACRPPIRMMNVGRCYRNETVSARSVVMFHQLDILAVDEGINMGDLIDTIRVFYRRIFGDVKMRIRSSYFPFVEPGLEVDLLCASCAGKGCSLCKNSGWLEVCGAGMVHPNVLEKAGMDNEKFSGFAWGLGIERIFSLLHGVDDIRCFLENDIRFLCQFC